MKIWQKCRVLVRGPRDELQFEDEDAELKQDGDTLSILYWDDDGAFGLVPGLHGALKQVYRSRPEAMAVLKDLTGFMWGWAVNAALRSMTFHQSRTRPSWR